MALIRSPDNSVNKRKLLTRSKPSPQAGKGPEATKTEGGAREDPDQKTQQNAAASADSTWA